MAFINRQMQLINRFKYSDAGVGIGMLVGPSEGCVGGGIPLNELQNPRFPFHVFWTILILYSRFSRVDKTDLKDLPARVFPTFFDL